MITVSRRSALAAVLVLAIAGQAHAEGKTVDLGKAYPFLEDFLKLPAAARNRFALAYYITQGGKPAAGLKAWIVQGPTRIPIPIRGDGRIERLPTLALFQSGAKISFDAPPTTKFGVQLSIEPLVRIGPEIDAPSLALAVAQADVAAHKAAGILGFAAPKLTRVYFHGAAGSEAVWADGRRVKLGVLKGLPYFDVIGQKGAKAIHFTKPPTRMEIGPAG